MSSRHDLEHRRRQLREFALAHREGDLAALLDQLATAAGPGGAEVAQRVRERLTRALQDAPSHGLFARLARLIATHAGTYVYRDRVIAADTAVRKGLRELEDELRAETADETTETAADAPRQEEG